VSMGPELFQNNTLNGIGDRLVGPTVMIDSISHSPYATCREEGRQGCKGRCLPVGDAGGTRRQL
jgi:hypothetical protein